VTEYRPTVLLEGLVFPEGPRWHDGRLWVADIHGHQIVTVDLDGRSEVVARIDKPNGMGFLPDGTLLAISMHARAVMKVVDGAAVVYADLREHGGQFLNDMVVDDSGLTYVGLRSWRQTGQAPASDDRIILIRPDGTSEVVAEGLTGPNGMLLTAGQDELVVAETHALRLTRFDRRPTGRLEHRRTHAELGTFDDGRKAFPDGICGDAAGAVWVGTAMSGEYLRVDADGTIGARFAPNAGWATACVLGGPERRHLFLATCNGSLEALAAFRGKEDADQKTDDAHQEYLAWARTQAQGFVEVVEVDTPGAGVP